MGQEGHERGFRNARSRLSANAGDPNHRVRDTIVAEGDPQWIVGKFAYGPLDKDLSDERVDVAVQRDGDGDFEPLGEAITTRDGDHPEVDGARDSGGRVYFAIPAPARLPLGRHVVRMTVVGDGTVAEGVLHVVPRGAALVVTDVDGTLTTSETIEVNALIAGVTPPVRADAANVVGILHRLGYVPVYLTARPEWLLARTRRFLREHGFPPGIVRTKDDKSGSVGPSAATYKRAELALLREKGLVVAFGLGNRTTDAEAYEAVVDDPRRRFFIELADEPAGVLRGGRSIASYTDIVEELSGLPPLIAR